MHTVKSGPFRPIIHAMDLFVIMVVAYFALLGLAMVFRKKTRTVSGPWWFLLRAFFPNWQFFMASGQRHVCGFGQWAQMGNGQTGACTSPAKHGTPCSGCTTPM